MRFSRYSKGSWATPLHAAVPSPCHLYSMCEGDTPRQFSRLCCVEGGTGPSQTVTARLMAGSQAVSYTFSALMSEQHTPPIFYDPRHRRWRRFTRTVQSIVAVGSCIVAVLLVSVLMNPVLPSLGLPPIR